MPDKPLYRIRNWSTHFETFESKRLKRLDWVAIPNKHDGKSYRRLMLMPDGAKYFAAWVLIVQVASKCTPRGTLWSDDGPLDAEDLHVKTMAPLGWFEGAFDALCKIGWLELVTAENSNFPADNKDAPAENGNAPTKSKNLSGHRTRQDITAQDRTVKNKNIVAPIGAMDEEISTKFLRIVHEKLFDLMKRPASEGGVGISDSDLKALNRNFKGNWTPWTIAAVWYSFSMKPDKLISYATALMKPENKGSVTSDFEGFEKRAAGWLRTFEREARAELGIADESIV